MTNQTPSVADIAEVINDRIACDPMWIGDDGEPLDYLPEREVLIGEFVYAVAEQVESLIAAREQAAAVRALRERDEAEKRWNTAVDWLLNEVDANDFVAPFWAYCDGIITKAELRRGDVGVTEINRRRERRDRIEGGGHE